MGRSRGKKIILRETLTAVLWIISICLNGQSIGDYRSAQSGDWDHPDTWELFGGTLWIPATSFPNDATKDVTIQSGHEVVYTESNAEIRNLTVESTGKLFTNSSGVYRYILVFGDILCNGTIGNGETTDGICLKPEGDTCKIYGAGDCRFRRVRKEANVNDTTILIIDTDLEIYYNGTGDALYNNLAGTFLGIEISPSGSLLLHASLDLNRCSFMQLSDPSGSGSLVCPDVQNSDSSNSSISQYIAKDNAWHFISSPVNNQALQPEFVPAPIDNTFDLYKWDEASPVEQAWVNVRDSTGNYSSNFESSFVAGRGYLIAFSDTNNGSPVRIFRGMIHDGDKQLNVEYGNNGWNLVGNPYPCSLDWSSSGITKSSVSGGAMYLWDQSLNGGAGGYRTHNGTVGVPASTLPFIPPMNGFFIHAASAGTIGIDISNDTPLVNSPQYFYKEGLSIPDAVRITLSGEGFSDECICIYQEGSANGYDPSDAIKMFRYHDSYPEIFTLADTISTVINCFGELPQSVNLGIYSPVSGSASIYFSDYQSFDPTVEIWFEDIRTGVTFSIWQQDQYTFFREEGSATDRFRIHFEDSFSGMGLAHKPDPFRITAAGYGRFRVHNNASAAGMIEVTGLKGELILQEELDGSESQVVYTGNRKGIYIISIKSADTIYSQKIFIY